MINSVGLNSSVIEHLASSGDYNLAVLSLILMLAMSIGEVDQIKLYLYIDTHWRQCMNLPSWSYESMECRYIDLLPTETVSIHKEDNRALV